MNSLLSEYSFLKLVKMPEWIPDNTISSNKRWLFLFLIFASIWVGFIVSTLQTEALIGTYIFLIVALFIDIYIIGRFYGEFNSNKDYIQLDESGLKFRDTPAFGIGWLPIERHYFMGEIYSADIIEISSFLSPSSRKLAILIVPTTGSRVILGSQFHQDQLIPIGLAMQGSISLSKAFQKFIGTPIEEVPSFRDVVDTAKSMWNKYQDLKKKKL